MKRRQFLKALGIAPVAAPAAAKAIADEAVLAAGRLTGGVGRPDKTAYNAAIGMLGSPVANRVKVESEEEIAEARLDMVRQALTGKVSDLIAKDHRDNARRMTIPVDPDLMALRSVSPSAKVLFAREAAIREMDEQYLHVIRERLVDKALGKRRKMINLYNLALYRSEEE